MHKFVKTIVIGSFVLVAVVFALAGLVFYSLPDAGMLAKFLRSSSAEAKSEVVENSERKKLTIKIRT